ncbi:MAG: MFS transporter [Desulfatiglandaceae bacterium]
MADIRFDNGYLVSKGYAHYIFVLLFLLYMFDWLDRMVVVSLFPFIKADWGLTDTQCGMLISAVSWSIVVLTFPVSIFIDRWSRKKSIGLMALLWSLATAACAFTRNYVQLFVARTVIGVGEAGYAPGGTTTISALFPEMVQVLGDMAFQRNLPWRNICATPNCYRSWTPQMKSSL